MERSDPTIAGQVIYVCNAAGTGWDLVGDGGGGGGSTTISIDAVNLTTQSPLNFQDTTEIDWTNPSAGNVQIALKASSVADSKLAQIVTASKVSGAAITLLTSLPAGAGNVPIANLPDFSGVGACGPNSWASTLNDNGAPTCTQPGFSNLSGAASLAQLPFGTANQLHKTNTGGTAVEQATLSIGTAGTDFAVAFAAGTITLNLPSASGTVRGALLSADWTIFNNSVDSVSGTTEEVSSSGGQTPVLSLPTVINLSGKTLKGGSPLVFEGLTADAFETTLVITDPTAARLFTLPNADSVAVQPKTCSGTDKVSDISALGVVTCTADQGGAGSGDNITVNTVPAVDADFDDATPAAPANAVNVKWQKDALTPNNLSAHLLFSTIGNATFGANADFTWTFDSLGATNTSLAFAGQVLTSGGFTRWDVPNELRNINATTLTISGRAPDGATAVGVISNNTAALVTAGAKIHSFQNASVEKSYIDKDGGFSGNAVTASALAGDPADCGANTVANAINTSGTLSCVTITSAYTSGTFPPTTTNLALLNAGNTWSTGAQSFAAATSLLLPASAGYAPTANGSVGYDPTQAATVAGGNGAVKGFFPRVLKMTNCTTEANCTGANQVDANAAAQGTTETNFASNWSMPANFLFTNKAIQVCALIELTSSASAPTLVIRLKAGSTVLAASGTSAAANNQTGKGFNYCWMVQGTAAAGASVSVEAGYTGVVYHNSGAGGFLQTDQPVTGIATNGALTIQISAQWGAATTGNTVQLHQFYVMEMN